MEETKELQNVYKVFRTLIYVTLLIEFFVYAMPYQTLASLGSLFFDFHDRLTQFAIYKHGNLIYSKIFTLVLVIITSIGTKNKKHIEFDAQKMVYYPLVAGLVLLILSVWVYDLNMSTRFYAVRANVWIYMIASIFGTLFVHTALDNIWKHLKTGLLNDRFNFENESFEQNEEKQTNKYSVNIPMRYYYKGKFRQGWVNITNPFRGTWVVGTPGSGKTFSIIEPFIKQHSAKGFAMVVYDYKFPTLATKLYYHYKKNKAKDRLPKGCTFNIINFVNVEYSRRVNPIQQKYINNLAAAQETAETLIESLQKARKKVVAVLTSSSRLLPSTSWQPASISSSTMRKSPMMRMVICYMLNESKTRKRHSENLLDVFIQALTCKPVSSLLTGWVNTQTCRIFFLSSTWTISLSFRYWKPTARWLLCLARLQRLSRTALWSSWKV